MKSEHKPVKILRRPDGSVVSFHRTQGGADIVEIKTASGELWTQSLNDFSAGKKPRLRSVTASEWGLLFVNPPEAHKKGKQQ